MCLEHQTALILTDDEELLRLFVRLLSTKVYTWLVGEDCIASEAQSKPTRCLIQLIEAKKYTYRGT